MRRTNKKLLLNCAHLRKAYEASILGNMKVPEDAQPQFAKQDIERRWIPVQEFRNEVLPISQERQFIESFHF